MNRMLVFLYLGPVLGVLVALSPDIARTGYSDILMIIGIVVFYLGFIVAAVAGVVDFALARVSLWLRLPITAVAGGVMVAGPFCAFDTSIVFWPALAAGGAFCAGVCSLLSHDFRRAKA